MIAAHRVMRNTFREAKKISKVCGGRKKNSEKKKGTSLSRRTRRISPADRRGKLQPITSSAANHAQCLQARRSGKMATSCRRRRPPVGGRFWGGGSRHLRRARQPQLHPATSRTFRAPPRHERAPRSRTFHSPPDQSRTKVKLVFIAAAPPLS